MTRDLQRHRVYNAENALWGGTCSGSSKPRGAREVQMNWVDMFWWVGR